MGGRLPAARLALAAADVSTSGSTGHVTMFCCISASRPFRTSEAGRLVRSTRSLSEVGPLLRRKEERVSIDSEKSVSMTCFATARCSAATKWEGGALICQSDERGRCDPGGGHGGTPDFSFGFLPRQQDSIFDVTDNAARGGGLDGASRPRPHNGRVPSRMIDAWLRVHRCPVIYCNNGPTRITTRRGERATDDISLSPCRLAQIQSCPPRQS